jgi:predicted amidophosphoribosyltransferase
MHISKRKSRGFNQAELIAQRFCDVTGLPLAVEGLTRVQVTQAQFQVGSASNRLHNLAGAFQVGVTFQRQLPRHPVLLVDDIYTTGATVQSATIALQKQGILVAGVAVVAKAKLDREQ